MLIVATRMQEMNFSALMEVYREGNAENGAQRYPHESATVQLLLAEQDFYQYQIRVDIVERHFRHSLPGTLPLTH